MKNFLTQIIDDGKRIHAADILRTVVVARPEGGMSLEVMMERQPLVAAINGCEADGDFEFTAEQAVAIYKLFREHKWGAYHDDIVRIGTELKAQVETKL